MRFEPGSSHTAVRRANLNEYDYCGYIIKRGELWGVVGGPKHKAHFSPRLEHEVIAIGGVPTTSHMAEWKKWNFKSSVMFR